MEIRISVAAEHGTRAVADLHRWLRRDADVRRHAEIRLDALPPAGAMGAVEIVSLVLGQGFAALNLALAYASWRTARPAAPPVTITAGGVSVTVPDASEESVRRIVELLRTLPPPALPEQRTDHSPAGDPHRSEP
ncbi:hypothetical protein [Streptomyces sp. CAU 1734]|uniref:effector-associated constant component EACC1 n=1 Tax=Streptomyces sp. CAU 1734 TaxID=3140360 RepID=UPI0032617151